MQAVIILAHKNIDQVIDSIIEANQNLKESMNAQDLEMVGKDLETLQTLLDQLEVLRNQEIEEAEENMNFDDDTESNIENENTNNSDTANTTESSSANSI